MIRLRFAFAPVGLALLLMTSAAQADIMVSLTEDGTTVSLTQSGNSFLSSSLSVGNYTFTIETGFVTTGSPIDPGSLASTSIIGSTNGSGTLDPLTVTIQAVNPAGSGGGLTVFNSSTTQDYSVLNSASVTAGPASLGLTGSSQFDAGDPNVAPVTLTGISAGTNTATFNNATGYMLATTYSISGITGGTSGIDLGFSTTVTPTSAPSSVPEPSSLVLTGLVALGMGGVALRRRLATRSA